MDNLETLTVDCGGREAHVETTGSGSDVLIVGAAVPMTWTRRGALALASRGFRVTNFDYGAGCADPEPRSALDQVADVVAVMNAVDLDVVVPVGLSRGAITAFGLAADHPELIRGLVLAMPVSGFAESLRKPQPALDGNSDPDDFLDRMVRLVFSPEFLADHHDDAVGLLTTPPGSVTRLERSEENPFSPGLTVGCPTLVIEAGKDQIVSSSHPARYLRAVPHARHVVVEQAWHGWPGEAPEEFAGVVAEFAASL